jgi:hypothetical protein
MTWTEEDDDDEGKDGDVDACDEVEQLEMEDVLPLQQLGTGKKLQGLFIVAVVFAVEGGGKITSPSGSLKNVGNCLRCLLLLIN